MFDEFLGKVSVMKRREWGGEEEDKSGSKIGLGCQLLEGEKYRIPDMDLEFELEQNRSRS